MFERGKVPEVVCTTRPIVVGVVDPECFELGGPLGIAISCLDESLAELRFRLCYRLDHESQIVNSLRDVLATLELRRKYAA